MWFVNDGAPAHFLRIVREHLILTFQDCWIDQQGPKSCPLRSPELDPLDSWLWGYLKALVYATPVSATTGLHLWCMPVLTTATGCISKSVRFLTPKDRGMHYNGWTSHGAPPIKSVISGHQVERLLWTSVQVPESMCFQTHIMLWYVLLPLTILDTSVFSTMNKCTVTWKSIRDIKMQLTSRSSHYDLLLSILLTCFHKFLS